MNICINIVSILAVAFKDSPAVSLFGIQNLDLESDALPTELLGAPGSLLAFNVIDVEGD